MLNEADSDESNQFALLRAYLKRIADTDEGSVCFIQHDSEHRFEAIAIAPAASINAC